MNYKKMKAIVYERYGGPEVLQIKDIDKPVPKKNEILIRIKATTVTKGDVRMRSFDVPLIEWIPARVYLGLFKPKRKILGMELSGVVEEIGSKVTKFKPLDEILASTFEIGFGGYGEYICMNEDGLVAIKPENLSYGEAAAAIGGGMTAIRCLKKAKIRKGQHILIYGASGAVGSCGVQVAKNAFGATVTAVCSTKNQEMAKAIGADYTIDYLNEDFTQQNQKYDIIFDAVSKLSKTKAKRVLKEGGYYLNVHKDAHSGAIRNDELNYLVKLLRDAKLKPYIDRIYRMDEAVEAHRYVDLGHKKGNVILKMDVQ